MSVTLENYVVISPATSAEMLKASRLARTHNAGIMIVTLATDREVPRPEERTESIVVLRDVATPNGDHLLIGVDVDQGNSIVMRTSHDGQREALASFVHEIVQAEAA